MQLQLTPIDIIAFRSALDVLMQRGRCLPRDVARFWAKVDLSGKTDGCWIWTGHTTTTGYGVIYCRSHNLLAHRLAYEFTFGSIPDGLEVLHRCDVRTCVAPHHLFVGTQQDNMRDMVTKMRNMHVSRPETLARGERQHLARLTEISVREIRMRAQTGESLRGLAREFGVQHWTIQSVVKRITWKHVA
jgi:hypothetical protein